MRLVLLAATFAVLCSSTPTSAQIAPGPRRPNLPLAGTITNPDWAARPDGAAMARVYPRIAQVMSLSGLVTMQCKVNEAGSVEDCEVLSEQPAGLGFGQAAILLAPNFKMKPKTVDGAAVGGAVVKIPISFRVAGDAPAPPPAIVSKASPAALALARRVVVAQGADRFIDQALDATVKQLRASEYAASSGAGASAQEPAIQAVVDAFHSEHQTLIDGLAGAYASQFDEKELAQLAQHFESPAQRLWLSRQGAITPLATEINRRLFTDISETARRSFCAKTTCPAPVSYSGSERQPLTVYGAKP